MDSVVETFPFHRVMHVRSHPGPIVDASIGGGHYPSSRSIGRAQSRNSALMMHEAIYPHSIGETPLFFIGSEIFMYDRYRTHPSLDGRVAHSTGQCVGTEIWELSSEVGASNMSYGRV